MNEQDANENKVIEENLWLFIVCMREDLQTGLSGCKDEAHKLNILFCFHFILWISLVIIYQSVDKIRGDLWPLHLFS